MYRQLTGMGTLQRTVLASRCVQASGTRGGWVRSVLAALLLSMGLASVQEPGAISPTRDRLTAPGPLAAPEIAALLSEIGRRIQGRGLRVTDGAAGSPVDDRGREVLFAILTGSLPVEDVGLRPTAAGAVRGLRAPATPPRSEVGAKQTLWIDVETLLPRRFEFAYEVPGLGDLAYDLVFDR